MSFDEHKRTEIIIYLLERIAMDDSECVRNTSDRFDISATSVKRYIEKCINEQILQKDDLKKCGYALRAETQAYECELSGDVPEEDILYSRWIEPFMADLPTNIQDIWAYTCMEMLNNAIEHSEGMRLSVCILRNYLYTEVVITDDGVGVFEKVRRHIGRVQAREACMEDALVELYKGKFTTAEENHSGERIFFSSKMMDQFIASANGTMYIFHDHTEAMVRHRLITYYQKLNHIGTKVIMRLSNFSTRRSQEVFDMYTNAEGGFVKTYIPIRDACQTEKPIARSQARRLMRRLEGFEEVVLDFSEVAFCGQGFADEVFRVFRTAHPEVELKAINADEDVMKMIRHVGFAL